jgi:hypothetical protein
MTNLQRVLCPHQGVLKTVFTHLADSRIGILLARLSETQLTAAYRRFGTVDFYDFIDSTRNMLHA